MKRRFLIFNCFIATAFVTREAFADESLVSIAPAKLTLHRATFDDSAGWESMLLSVSNRTDRNWRFSNFYDSWSPILVSSTGEVLHPGLERDKTRFPQAADYPLLEPGQQVTAKRKCAVVRVGEGLRLILQDGTGGDFSAVVTPGDYKLCISYQAQTGHDSLFGSEAKRNGVERTEVWQGWAMSNWINISIHDEAK